MPSPINSQWGSSTFGRISATAHSPKARRSDLRSTILLREFLFPSFSPRVNAVFSRGLPRVFSMTNPRKKGTYYELDNPLVAAAEPQVRSSPLFLRTCRTCTFYNLPITYSNQPVVLFALNFTLQYGSAEVYYASTAAATPSGNGVASNEITFEENRVRTMQYMKQFIADDLQKLATGQENDWSMYVATL